jgi:hypothetical protein
VQTCEETKGPEACEDTRTTLLECYQDVPVDKFECEIGILATIRVAEDVCQAERDALYECAAPGTGECLDVCRSARADVDAELLDGCAFGSTSCEEVCWLVAQSGMGLVDSGVSSPSDLLILQLGLLCAAGDAGSLPIPK